MSFRTIALIPILVAIQASFSVAQIASGSINVTQQVILSGAVKSIQWGNPRSLIHLVVTDAQGISREWTLEGNSKEIFTAFDQPGKGLSAISNVSVVVRPLKNNQSGGVIVSMTPQQ